MYILLHRLIHLQLWDTEFRLKNLQSCIHVFHRTQYTILYTLLIWSIGRQAALSINSDISTVHMHYSLRRHSAIRQWSLSQDSQYSPQFSLNLKLNIVSSTVNTCFFTLSCIQSDISLWNSVYFYKHTLTVII